MNWKLYKPGQGYWTRLLTGVAGGVLVVGGAAWIIKKLEGFITDLQTLRYTQAIIFVTFVTVFGLLVYRIAGVSQRSNDFFIATEGEMKKVNWPSQKEVRGSTWVVIWCLILMTTLLFSADLLFSKFFLAIGILEGDI